MQIITDPHEAAHPKGHKKLLLISGYDAASHKHWRQILEKQLHEYDWTQIALPDRYYAWRIRGNAITLANQYAAELNRDYDCLIVTSMVDLNSLRGFIPKLATIPAIVYCHENQFDYPRNSQPQEDANRLNAQLSAIFSMKCADKVLFNSKYNQTTFIKGAKQLFKKLPDGVSISDIEEIESKSSVLAVPIKNFNIDSRESLHNKVSLANTSSNQPISIVWNHRWGFDKQPEVLFEAIKLLAERQLNFRVDVLGQSFRKVPKCFAAAKKELAEFIGHWGFQPRAKYDQILTDADVVVSTALHDFQGLSMLEAISLGCIPLAPNRVAYPEYIDQTLLYAVDKEKSESHSLALKLEWLIKNWQQVSSDKSLKFSQQVNQYSCEQLIPEYRKQIESVSRQ